MIRTVPVDPDGPVIQDDNQIEEISSPEIAANRHTRARVQLCQHTNGLWMWSSSIYYVNGGRSYRVGPKWGNFADTKDEAIHAACDEIRGDMADLRSPTPANALGQISHWLDSLDGQKQMELFS